MTRSWLDIGVFCSNSYFGIHDHFWDDLTLDATEPDLVHTYVSKQHFILSPIQGAVVYLYFERFSIPSYPQIILYNSCDWNILNPKNGLGFQRVFFMFIWFLGHSKGLSCSAHVDSKFRNKIVLNIITYKGV
jgi:hypothetical protein